MLSSSPLLSAPNECESLKFNPPSACTLFLSREENWSKGTTARATAVGRLEFDHNRPNNACILRWTSGIIACLSEKWVSKATCRPIKKT
jgi:hypothetical protein